MTWRQRLAAWLDERAGLSDLRDALQRDLSKPVPAGIRWAHTLGFSAAALLGVQLLTGVLLLLYYRPTTGSAWASVVAIAEEVPWGWMVRSLHIWGSHFIVAALGLHALRVFCSGAYKRPREGLWLVGMVLMALVLSLAFTGTLLPWDQKGYWGTTIATEMAAAAPLGGDLARRLVRGSNEVGDLTLGRFFAAHVVVLPALLVAFMGLHLLGVRKLGITPPGVDAETEHRKGHAALCASGSPWFPDHLLRELAMVAWVIGTLWAVAALAAPAIEDRASSLQTPVGVRPEWYFLPLYQLQKYFAPERWLGMEGSTRGFLVTNLLLVLPLLLPFVDRTPSRRLRERKLVLALGGAWLLGMGALGILGALAERDLVIGGKTWHFDLRGWPTEKLPPAQKPAEPAPEPWRSLDQPDEACATCHQGEWRAFADSVHFKVDILSCTGCHGGDYEATEAVAAHSAEEDFDPAPLSFCSDCHELESERLADGPHGSATRAGTMRGCIECHGDHEVARPNHGLVVSACTGCHEQDAEILASAQATRLSLAALDEGLPRAGLLLREVRAATGFHLEGQQRRLADASDLARRQRSLQHTMALEEIREVVDAATADAARIASDAEQRLAAAQRRPSWALLALMLGMINAGLLLALRSVLTSRKSS